MTRSAVRRTLATLLAAALLAVAGASTMETIEFDGFTATFDPNQEFLVLEGDLDCTRFGGPAAVRVTETSGRAGDADYLVYLPVEWNGDLVLFGHGQVDGVPDGQFWFPLPLGFGAEPAEMPFVVNRDVALCDGFAWAASAFARHGPAYEDAIRDTHLLQPVARHHLPMEPDAVFVTGLSLGGLVAVALAETYPHRYAGALADRAGLGGMIMVVGHMAQTRGVFDVFFPGLVDPARPDDRSLTVPEFMAFREALLARIQAEPEVLARMASVRLYESERWDPDGVGIPLLLENPHASNPMAAFNTLVNSLMVRISANLMGGDAFRAMGYVGMPWDIREFVFTGFGWTAEEEADLNAQFARFEPDFSGIDHWRAYYEPTGRLEIPVVAMFASHDPLVTVVNAWAYQDAVDEAGASDLYSAWVIERYGHGTITPPEIATAFRGLVAWVRTGERPTWPTAP
jgi:pimeloyl-ACP methyl ester carboxylesterase